MKSSTLKTMLAAIALTFVASSASAASPNGPKPRCPNLGEIPVFVNGMWVCKAPSIKAKGNGLESVVGGANKKIKKPVRVAKKPDLFVIAVENNYYEDPTKIRVVVRNKGAIKSGSAVLLGTVNGLKAEGSIPSMNPTYAKAVTLKFAKPMKRGDRLKFVADSKGHIDESNENNNVKHSIY